MTGPAAGRFDVVVVGGGPGGYAAAIRAAQNGLSTVLVEQGSLGGTCLNLGCIPTKALLRSAEVADTLRRDAGPLGISCEGITLDYAQAQRRSREVVHTLVHGVQALMKKNRIQVLAGRARLLGAGRVQVNGRATDILESEAIILATGSSPRPLPHLPFDGRRVLSSDDAVALTYAPARMVIIGAGPIGLEFACVFSAFGSKVVVIEQQSQVAPAEDVETAAVLAAALAARGIDIRLNADLARGTATADSVLLHLNGRTDPIAADQVLVAVGRSPNTSDLGLEIAGIRMRHDFVVVDDRLRTSQEGVWAVGDITGGAMLAHRAMHQGMLAADDIAGKPVHRLDPMNVPSCIYTHPQLASVGMTEARARAAGLDVKVSRFPLAASGKAQASGQTEGMVKIVADARYGEVLGAHVVGAEATELIAEFVLAKTHELGVSDIADAMHPHPTVSEAIGEAAMGWAGGALHW